MEGSILGVVLYMVQLKRELNHLEKKYIKKLKRVDFTNFFNLKKPQNRAKLLLFQT